MFFFCLFVCFSIFDLVFFFGCWVFLWDGMGSHYVDQTDLRLEELRPSASQPLGVWQP